MYPQHRRLKGDLEHMDLSLPRVVDRGHKIGCCRKSGGGGGVLRGSQIFPQQDMLGGTAAVELDSSLQDDMALDSDGGVG